MRIANQFQPSAMNSNSLLPEDIKEMKTEDQILAQLRATQNIGPPSTQFMSNLQGPPAATPKPDDSYAPNVHATPHSMEELQKLIQTDMLTGQSVVPDNCKVADPPLIDFDTELQVNYPFLYLEHNLH